jgi:hypothetical protein
MPLLPSSSKFWKEIPSSSKFWKFYVNELCGRNAELGNTVS